MCGSAPAYLYMCVCLLVCMCVRRELCVAYLPNLDEISSTHLEPKLPLEALTPVMQSCIDGSKEVYQLLQVLHTYVTRWKSRQDSFHMSGRFDTEWMVTICNDRTAGDRPGGVRVARCCQGARLDLICMVYWSSFDVGLDLEKVGKLWTRGSSASPGRAG